MRPYMSQNIFVSITNPGKIEIIAYTERGMAGVVQANRRGKRPREPSSILLVVLPVGTEGELG